MVGATGLMGYSGGRWMALATESRTDLGLGQLSSYVTENAVDAIKRSAVRVLCPPP